MKTSQCEYESVSKKKVYADGISKEEEKVLKITTFLIIFKATCACVFQHNLCECFIDLLIIHVRTSGM